MFHLSINHVRISFSVAFRSVAKKASVRSSPFGSRTTTHFIETGSCPGVYQREMPENISSVRLTPSYQTIVMKFQLVNGSLTRSDKEDCFPPFLGLGPR